MISDLDFMKIQVETLFIHDEKGRLTFINAPDEPEKYPAPQLFLGCTEAGLAYRFRNDLDSTVCEQLEDLILSEPQPVNLSQRPEYSDAIEEVLRPQAPVQKIWKGPASRFPDHSARVSGVVNVERHHAEILAFGFPDLISELDSIQPCMGIVEEGKVVSICQSVRKSSRAEEAGVDTLFAYRGRGYAPRVVSAWAAAVQEKGKIPFYSTSWDNKASRRVAQKLGLISFGVDFHFT